MYGFSVSGREHDIENIQRAHDLATDIADWMRDTEGWQEFAYYHSGYDSWVLNLDVVGVPALDNLYLLLVQKDNPYFRASGFGFAGEQPVIVLKVLDERGVNNPNLGNWLAVGHRIQLEHELVHYLDYLRIGQRIEGELEEGELEEADWMIYFNSPSELNARWQEAATSLVRLLTHPTKPEAREASRAAFLKDYGVFRAALWKGLDADFVEALTESNLRKLEKRTWQLFQNLVAWEPAEEET